MTPSHRALRALAGSVAFASLISTAAIAQAPPPVFRTVVIPVLPQGTVCVDEKTALIERASGANAVAAENAQAASRFVVEREAALRTAGEQGTAELDRLRTERDRRIDEWRRAEAAFDAAVRLSERNCPAERTAASPPTTAPAAPASGSPVVTAPVATPTQPSAPPVAAANHPAVSLALTIAAPETCRANTVCTFSVEIENRGTRPMASPLLASVALGFDGGTIAGVAAESWACGRGNENLTCASAGLTLDPQARSRFTVEWRLPDRLRRPSATVCAAVVWPNRQPGGIYRAEQVAAVQYALTRAGFDTGGVTGRIGPRTIEAIRTLRQRAGIQGPAEITPDLLDNLFGANGALAGDDDPANDRGCATIAFADDRGAPIAAVPPTPRPERPQVRQASPEAQPTPPPRAQAQAPRPQQTEPRRQVRRPPPPPVDYDDDDDDVVTVYRTPIRPPVVYYGGPRWHGGPTYYYRPWGPPVIVRPW